MSLRIVPVTRDQAHAFIAEWHRHHRPPVGYRYALGVADGDTLVGVATAGRPVARLLDDGLTIEVTRCCVADGARHACSALYAACWRAAKAMGYRAAITYTQAGESGASLRAAGWLLLGKRKPRDGWNTPSRPRTDRHPVGVDRLLWGVTTGRACVMPGGVARPECRTGNIQLDLLDPTGGAA